MCVIGSLICNQNDRLNAILTILLLEWCYTFFTCWQFCSLSTIFDLMHIGLQLLPI